MDSERFDQLTRTLASGQSRRSLLKGLTGTAVAGLLAAAGVHDAAARSRVGICHLTDDGTYKYITVDQSAVPAHEAHGDVVTDLTDVANCGTCGNACSAPANASATCGGNGCGFVCNEGYEVTETGGACQPIGPCPTGYELVGNDGCFQIVAGLDNSLCTNTCSVYGSVPGSGNFLCGTKVASFDPCASDLDCGAEQFCFPHRRGNYCVNPC